MIFVLKYCCNVVGSMCCCGCCVMKIGLLDKVLVEMKLVVYWDLFIVVLYILYRLVFCVSLNRYCVIESGVDRWWR